jgi:O-antigen/teichoic acid export membrane protein
LAGSAYGALLGFSFNLVLARLMGAESSGVVLQAIAAFTIALSVGRLGADTCAVWILPPMAADEPHLVRRTVLLLLGIAALGTSVLAGGWLVVVGLTDIADSPERGALVAALTVMAPFLPAAGIMMVSLASTRAFGGVLPFNLIANALVPTLRVLLLVTVVGAGVQLVSLGWGATWAIGAVTAVGVLAVLVRRASPAGWGHPPPVRRVLRFSLPRALSSGLEQSIIWVDVLLVGLLLGNQAAGVYGAASRFVAAGVIVSTAVRIVVAPRFSALLAARRTQELRQLYLVTALWVLAFGAPIYLGLSVFAPTVLGWLGPGFGDGVPAMVILCLGAVVVLAAGNVQSLLLMSGHSAWAAMNKLAVLSFNVVGNLVVIPRAGITGAAAVWAASMTLDTVLASVQARRATGVVLELRPVLRTALLVAVAVVGPAGLVAWVFGQGTPQFVVAALAAAAGWAVMLYVERHRLRLSDLRSVRGGRAVAAEETL